MELHGLELNILSEWEDETIFQFRLPVEQAPSVMTAKLKTGNERVFHPNIVVRRFGVDQNFVLETAFKNANAEQMRDDPSFRVVASGVVKRESADLAWQDVSRTIAATALTVMQREIIAYRQGEGHLCWLSIMTHRGDLDKITADLGIRLG